MHAPNHGLRHRLYGTGLGSHQTRYVSTGYVQYRPELRDLGTDRHVGLVLIEPWWASLPLSIWTDDRLTPLV